MRLFQQAGADKLAAFLLAEKLLFHPFRLHPGGRNDDERTIGARAPEVEDARRDFLARACGTADQNTAAGNGDPLQRRPAVVEHRDRDRQAENRRRVIGLFEPARDFQPRSEEHTSELQSLMRISYAVFCLKKKKIKIRTK